MCEVTSGRGCGVSREEEYGNILTRIAMLIRSVPTSGTVTTCTGEQRERTAPWNIQSKQCTVNQCIIAQSAQEEQTPERFVNILCFFPFSPCFLLFREVGPTERNEKGTSTISFTLFFSPRCLPQCAAVLGFSSTSTISLFHPQRMLLAL